MRALRFMALSNRNGVGRCAHKSLESTAIKPTKANRPYRQRLTANLKNRDFFSMGAPWTSNCSPAIAQSIPVQVRGLVIPKWFNIFAPISCLRIYDQGALSEAQCTMRRRGGALRLRLNAPYKFADETRTDLHLSLGRGRKRLGAGPSPDPARFRVRGSALPRKGLAPHPLALRARWPLPRERRAPFVEVRIALPLTHPTTPQPCPRPAPLSNPFSVSTLFVRVRRKSSRRCSPGATRSRSCRRAPGKAFAISCRRSPATGSPSSSRR